MRPNFLIFITDQHRADHLGCYGNPVVKTPNIDALAGAGQRFDRAYVANPVCMPNRGSIMTGRMPSVHGARSNGIPLPLESVTFADLLSEAGYHTALIGKSHLQNMEDQAPLLTPPQHPEGTHVSTQFPEARRPVMPTEAYDQELRSSWDNPAHHISTPFYGFQDVVLCNHHADECFGDWLRWLQAEHPERAAQIGRKHSERDPRYVAPQAWRTNLDENTYPTNYIAEQTAQWIRQHTEQQPDQPFAVMCSFPDPHHPWTPPGRYWDMYDPATIEVPASMKAGGESARHVNWLLDERRQGQAKLDGPRLFAASEREVQEMIALTYGMITNIDDRIGMVMDALRDCGADSNTVVIFTSDHGDLMGDHGIVLKGPLHYQSLIRVPLIWREPAGVHPGQPLGPRLVDGLAHDHSESRRRCTGQRQPGPASADAGWPGIAERARRHLGGGKSATGLPRLRKARARAHDRDRYPPHEHLRGRPVGRALQSERRPLTRP